MLIREELEQKFQTVELQQSEMIFETNHFVFDEPKISCYQIELYIQCNKVEQPALRINIISGLQKLRCNSLTYIPATEKRLDFVQRRVNKELPPYSYKTPRKRKPPDKISFTIRGLDWDNNYYYVPTTDKYTIKNCNLMLNLSWDRTQSGKYINKENLTLELRND